MLTVTRDPDGEDGVLNIPISKVCYLQYASHFDRVVVHTLTNEYYMPGTLKYWTAAFNASGFKFYHADRSASINVENVAEVERNFHYIDFGGNKKKCTVAFHKINNTAKSLYRLNPNIKITPAF